GGDVHLLVAGKDCGGAAEGASKLQDIAKVLLADDAAYDHMLAEDVAALLDVAPISDISGVVSPDTFVRPIYAGNALATVQSKDKIKVITVRGTAFPADAKDGGSAPIEKIDATSASGLSHFVSAELTKSERPELTSAKIVVSGGRGMQNGDNFKLLDSL